MKEFNHPRSRFSVDATTEKSTVNEQVKAPAPRWGWPELFIVVQFVSTGLLFIPGTQPYRVIIRALPYLMSGFLLVYYLTLFFHNRHKKWKEDSARVAQELDDFQSSSVRGVARQRFPFHAIQGWLGAVILLLIAGWLFHPNSHFSAGLAQVFFQAMIIAPAFWAVLVVKNRDHLVRLLVLTFMTNFLSAGLGVLQVYYPDTFNPSEFTTKDPEILKRLVYTGPSGKQILRPCGLSDTPGYAAYSGLFCGFLGLAIAFAPKIPVWSRVFFLFGAGLGPLVLLLTQVRSLFIVLILALGIFAFLIFMQRRIWQFQLISGIGAAFVIGAVVWAVNIGGESMTQRFAFLWGQQDYKDLAHERGQFWTYTLQELLPMYPLGAGVGRWGAMQLSFNNDPTNQNSSPLYVEIQLTGWLFDGGYLMWILYPLAILFALIHIFNASLKQWSKEISFWYAVVFALNLSAAIQAYSGPTFNTQFGIIFWFFSGAVIGVIFRDRESEGHAPSDSSFNFANHLRDRIKKRL